MSELTKKEQIVIDRIEQLTFEGELSDDCLVQIIELCGKYLNLETIPNAAKRTGKSYNGIKKTSKIIALFGVKFVKE